MCTGKIEQTVPNGPYDYKTVEGKCGQTGYHGSPVFCDECQKDGTARRELARIDAMDREDW